MTQAGETHDRARRKRLGQLHAGLISGIVCVMEIEVRELLRALQRATPDRSNVGALLGSASGGSEFGKYCLRRVEGIQGQKLRALIGRQFLRPSNDILKKKAFEQRRGRRFFRVRPTCRFGGRLVLLSPGQSTFTPQQITVPERFPRKFLSRGANCGNFGKRDHVRPEYEGSLPVPNSQCPRYVRRR